MLFISKKIELIDDVYLGGVWDKIYQDFVFSTQFLSSLFLGSKCLAAFPTLPLLTEGLTLMNSSSTPISSPSKSEPFLELIGKF